MKHFKRIFLVVLDGVGAGALPDAHLFHDENSNTLGHVYEKVGLNVPNMSSMGLCKIVPFPQQEPQKGAWGKMAEKSMGKDTTTGHWELAGVLISQAFPVYPQGFPDEILKPFCEAIGRDILGNYPASGTEIIQKLGDEHVKTGKPIVYTSADSVFQIAAHEKIIPLDELYRICKIARELLTGKHSVGRVIARPFIGTSGNYTRTKARHDFSLEPIGTTVLDVLKQNGFDSIGVGKIEDIFAGRGITKSYPDKGNEACFNRTLDLIKEKNQRGLIFVNLVDFDMLYGHRKDSLGFKNALEWFDQNLVQWLDNFQENDLLLITADHGNDPTLLETTDHAREYVPLLAYHSTIGRIDLGILNTFSDIAQTIAENFQLPKLEHGLSFLAKL